MTPPAVDEKVILQMYIGAAGRVFDFMTSTDKRKYGVQATPIDSPQLISSSAHSSQDPV